MKFLENYKLEGISEQVSVDGDSLELFNKVLDSLEELNKEVQGSTENLIGLIGEQDDIYEMQVYLICPGLKNFTKKIFKVINWVEQDKVLISNNYISAIISEDNIEEVLVNIFNESLLKATIHNIYYACLEGKKRLDKQKEESGQPTLL